MNLLQTKRRLFQSITKEGRNSGSGGFVGFLKWMESIPSRDDIITSGDTLGIPHLSMVKIS